MCSVQSDAPETNVRIDNRLYDEVGDSWWRADSLLYQLKASLNPVRLAYTRRKLFDELRLESRGKQALEVGCGGGLVCEEIARLGFDVTGIDPSGPSLAAATLHARSSGLAIRYKQTSGESLPYPEGSFDVLFCFDVLEHVWNLPQVIREVARARCDYGLCPFDDGTLERAANRGHRLPLRRGWRGSAGRHQGSGGVTISQRPDTASQPGMPESAIASGYVDFIPSPEGIAAEVIRPSRNS
jgi:SAM-dependent methyltransferase